MGRMGGGGEYSPVVVHPLLSEEVDRGYRDDGLGFQGIRLLPLLLLLLLLLLMLLLLLLFCQPSSMS